MTDATNATAPWIVGKPYRLQLNGTILEGTLAAVSAHELAFSPLDTRQIVPVGDGEAQVGTFDGTVIIPRAGAYQIATKLSVIPSMARPDGGIVR